MRIDVTSALVDREAALVRPALRVYMVDLLPTVPYYTGHLCAALAGEDSLQLGVGSVAYHLDRDYFERQQVRPDPALLDWVSQWRAAPVPVRRWLKLGEYLANLASLYVRLRRGTFDLVHIQFLPLIKLGLPVELWFLRALKAQRIPFVYTVHNVLPQDTGEKHRQAFGEIYSLATRLICHDQSAAGRLVKEFAIDPQKISLVQHGPLHGMSSTAGGERLRQKLGIRPEDCLVLCQGILRPYKGVPFLLKAWKRLQDSLPSGSRAHLAVVGSGEPPVVEELRQEARTLGIQESVIFDFRFVSVEEVADYSSAADVLAYPYREITTSGALMTGILYGKAIVATDHPVFRQVLRPGENALLAEYGQVDEFAQQLKRLVLDPALRLRLGQQASKSGSSAAQWPEIAKETADCYRRAYESGGGAKNPGSFDA